MWATGSLLSSSRLWPSTTPTGKQGPFTVSASPSRYSRPRKNINININYDEEEEEEKEEEKEEERLNQETWKQDIGDLEEQPKISGSVVLLALQKATAQKKTKIKINNNNKKKKTKTTIKEEDATSSDYSHVKPLCINTHWKDRLDELETHLHHLIHNNT